MLDPWIIEQIRRREQDEERRRNEERPVLEIPLERPEEPTPQRPPAQRDDRGVTIIDYRI